MTDFVLFACAAMLIIGAIVLWIYLYWDARRNKPTK
jgi:hypothetical protein